MFVGGTVGVLVGVTVAVGVTVGVTVVIGMSFEPVATQAAVSVTVTSRWTEPEAPAVKVICAVAAPEVMDPPVIDQAYAAPATGGTEAVRPVAPGSTEAGAAIVVVPPGPKVRTAAADVADWP